MSGLKIKEKEIVERVEKNFSSQVKFLSRLVQEKSVNRGEEGKKGEAVEVGMARLLRKELTGLGVTTKYLRSAKNRPNVLGIWGPVRSRRSLALVGHMDTDIPPWGDEDSWFSGRVSQGRLYGAGSLNMKGSLAAYIFAMKALMDLKMKPMGQLKIVYSVDGALDRTSSLGLKFLVKKGFKAGSALLAKPGMDKIAVAHRGVYRFSIKTYGETVNTGRRVWETGEKGKNAIADMGRVMRKLSNFDLPYKPAKAFPGRLPVFTFPVKISGGKNINSVPDFCQAWGDVRLLPGNTDSQVRLWIEDRLSGLTDVDWELRDEFYVPAMEVERNEKLVSILSEVAGKTLKKKPRVEGCGPWNEAWMLTCSDTPCIAGFGPEGQEGDDGQPEWVDLESLKKLTMILAESIWRYLGDLRDRKI